MFISLAAAAVGFGAFLRAFVAAAVWLGGGGAFFKAPSVPSETTFNAELISSTTPPGGKDVRVCLMVFRSAFNIASPVAARPAAAAESPPALAAIARSSADLPRRAATSSPALAIYL
jgi:hypothetical protein